MRKKREIVQSAIDLAGELSKVADGSFARRGSGDRVDVSKYAHGAAVALGLLAMYAHGCVRPTVEEVLCMAIDWSDRLARDVAEHPEGVSSKDVDLRGEGADHE